MRNMRTSYYLSGASGLLRVGGRLLLAGSAHRRFAFPHRNLAAIAFWFGTDNQPSVRADR